MGGIESLGLSLGGSVAGSLGGQIGYGLGELTGYNDALQKRQLEQQKALTNMQYGANLGLMKESYKQQLEMWKNTNYQAQMKELQKAGLNPALMYGHAGAGGTTGGGGASVGGGNASGTAQMQEANNMSAMGGMAMMKLASEIKVNESIARLNQTEADKKGGIDTDLSKGMLQKVNSEINNISADTALKDEQIKLNQLQQDSIQIANEFNVQQNTQILQKTLQEIKELSARANVAEATQNSLIELAKQNVNKILSDITVNDSKISLNEMQKSVMRQQILEIVNTIKVSNGKLTVEQGQLQNAINALEQNKELKIRELHSGAILNQIRGVANLINQTFGYYTDYSKAGEK